MDKRNQPIPNVIAIIGDSGAGKTYAAEFISKEFDIPTLVSYTTRPKRENELDGVDHYFIDHSGFQSDFPNFPIGHPEVLAYVKFNNYHYWVTLSELQRQARGDLNSVVYVVDEIGLADLLHRQIEYGDIFVTSIYISAKDEAKRDRGVTEDRIARDRNRLHFNQWLFDYSIQNDGTFDEFKEKLTKTISHILNI